MLSSTHAACCAESLFCCNPGYLPQHLASIGRPSQRILLWFSTPVASSHVLLPQTSTHKCRRGRANQPPNPWRLRLTHQKVTDSSSQHNKLAYQEPLLISCYLKTVEHRLLDQSWTRNLKTQNYYRRYTTSRPPTNAFTPMNTKFSYSREVE